MAVRAKRKRSKPSSAKPVTTVSDGPRFWQTSTARWSLLSAVALWCAFPTVGLFPLAWIAPYGWLKLIETPELDGKRPLTTLYLFAYLHWLLMTWWVTLPHPAAAVGWMFLAAYLAIYLLGFILLGRWLVHRASWPLLLAAPVAWVTLEFARSYLFTGWALLPLSHTQTRFLPILQMADVTGAYGVSFLIMLVATAFFTVVSRNGSRVNGVERSKGVGVSIGIAVAAFAAALGYGYWDLNQIAKSDRAAKIAIVQGCLDTEFVNSWDDAGRAKEKIARADQAYNQYLQMTRDVTSKAPLDLVIWPESMFRGGIMKFDADIADVRPTENSYTFKESAEIYDVEAIKILRPFRTPSLMGTRTEHYHQDSQGTLGVDAFNTAALFDAGGNLEGTYYKMHPVMFGEYFPLGDVFPWIYRFTPLQNGLSAGTEPKSVPAGDIFLAPNICFENTVPHLIRRQVRELQASGKKVDALVTLTNDGWFWGSSLLDSHLNCGILRAVENRKPMLIAANTGFSAHVGPHGRVLQQGPRRASQVLVVDVPASEGTTIYTRWGDVFARCCMGVATIGFFLGWRRSKSTSDPVERNTV